MRRCRSCDEPVRGDPEQIGARCPYCREPLYERPDDGDAPAGSNASTCALHTTNGAVSTCQRCGNYVCGVCWTRWRGRALCVACVERSLTTGEAAPAEQRATRRQAVVALMLGIAAWVVAGGGVLLWLAASLREIDVVLIGFGTILLLGSVLPALLGIAQAAASIRVRGEHLLLATAGLLLCGLHTGMLVGLLSIQFWQS